MEKLLDLLGGLSVLLMFVAPLIIMPIVWRLMDVNKVVRIIIGLILSGVCSWFFFYISMEILFRNEMWSG